MALEACSEPVQVAVEMGLLLGAFLISLLIIWRSREGIKQFLVENRTEKKRYLFAFTTVGMILFIGVELFMAIIMLETI